MAISHICLDCGLDLARVRPEREPHYALKIVTCPRCRGVSVRRRHPVEEGVRNLRRTIRSVLALVGNGVATVILLFSTMETWPAVWSILGDITKGEVFKAGYLLGADIVVLVSIPVWAVFVIMSGIWISSVYGHWKRSRIWMTWMGVLLLIAVYPWFRGLLESAHAQISGDLTFDWWRGPVWSWVRICGVGVIAALTLIGLPIGAKIHMSYRHHRHVRWCRRRQKMRKWRTAE